VKGQIFTRRVREFTCIGAVLFQYEMEISLIFHVAYGGLSFIQEELKPKKKKQKGMNIQL